MVTGTIRFLALAAGALFAALPQTAAADAFVAGDSLGQGLAAAAGLPNRAHISVRLAQDEPIEQMAALPRGSIVYMSLGTNDAVGPVDRLGPAIDRIVTAARERQIRLVWIGPPCTRSRRVPNVGALDTMLRGRVRGPGVTYVSAVEGPHCATDLRARDGIHFTPRGYRVLWELARAAVEGPRGTPPTGTITVARSQPVAQGQPVVNVQPVVRASTTPRAPGQIAPADVAHRRTVAAVPPAIDRGRPQQGRPGAIGGPMRLVPAVVQTVPAPRPVPAPPAPRPPSFWPFSGS